MWMRWVFYSVALAGGMLICFHPTILSGFKRMQADPGDTVLNHLLLEHSWKWLSDPSYPASYWSPGFFYPATYTLTYSENFVGMAPLYWGLRLGIDDQPAYQWWMIIVAALNFVAMVVALRWFGVYPTLAAVGGFVFAFGFARQAQLNHQHLLPQWFAPLAVWHLWQLLREPQRRNWFWLLLMTAWQVLASIHLGWFLIFALGAWLVVIVVLDWRSVSRLRSFLFANPMFVTATTAGWLVGLGLFFRNYYIGNQDVRRHYVTCLEYMPLIIDWLACPPGTLWGLHLYPLRDVKNHEKYLCPGISFWIMAVFALFWGIQNRKSETLRIPALLARTSIIAGVLLIFLTVRLGEVASPWWIIYHVIPGANSIRAIARVCLVVQLLGLVGGLIALHHCLESRARRQLWYALIFLFACGEQICFERMSFDRAAFYGLVRERAKQLSNADAAIVLFEPGHGRKEDQEILAAWSGFVAGMPMINGYSGREPPRYPDTTQDDLAEIIQFLGDDWQGRLLVVDPSDGWQRTYYNVQPGRDPKVRVSPFLRP